MDESKIKKENHDGVTVIRYGDSYVGKTYLVPKGIICTEISLGYLSDMDTDTAQSLLKLGVMLDCSPDDGYLSVKRFFYNDEKYAIAYWYSVSKIYNLIKED